MRRILQPLLLTALAIFIVGSGKLGAEEAKTPSSSDVSAEPTWLMTVPTADALPAGDYVVGVVQGGTLPFNADVGALWKNLQVGIHGVKLQLLRENQPWAGLAVGATFGYYPSGLYVVGSKRLSGMRVHLGARVLPFTFSEDTRMRNTTASGDGMEAPAQTSDNPINDFNETFEIFAGVEKPMVENRVRLLMEVSNTLNAGFRLDVTPSWVFDVGVRVGLPERLRRSIGKEGEAFAYTSRDATAYIGFSFLSNLKRMGPPKELVEAPSEEKSGQ